MVEFKVVGLILVLLASISPIIVATIIIYITDLLEEK